MRGQFARHSFDALDHAALEISSPEIRFHLLADFLPAGGAYLGVDAAVGDDLDVAIGEQKVDQHAVIVRGVPDPELRENIQRPFPRRLIAKQRCAIERALDHETHLSRVGGLA